MGRRCEARDRDGRPSRADDAVLALDLHAAPMNLTLYTVAAFIVLDSDGQRVLAKYYAPKLDGLTGVAATPAHKPFAALKDQRAFEKGLFAKTKKPNCA
jgi:hypothetical protein